MTRRRTSPTLRRPVPGVARAVAFGIVLALVACSSDDDARTAASTAAAPDTTTSDAATTTSAGPSRPTADRSTAPSTTAADPSLPAPTTAAPTTVPTTTTTAPPAPPPPPERLAAVSFALQPVYDLPKLTAMASRPDSLTILASETGEVWRVQEGAEPVIVLDLTAVVTPWENGSERGLLGAAFHPLDGRLYLCYTDVEVDSHLVSYAVGADGGIDPATARGPVRRAARARAQGRQHRLRPRRHPLPRPRRRRRQRRP